MGFRFKLIIDLFKPRIGWESRKKIEKEVTILREKIKIKKLGKNLGEIIDKETKKD